MKKFLIIVMAVLLPVMASAQAQINTKKVKIGDFTQKITKVVLTGNMLFDAVFQDEVAARWRISPYEFCTLDEFEELKGDDNYYFLIPTKGQFRKETEPGLMFLTLVKGGNNAQGIDEMLEIVSVPIASAENSSGREFGMLPVFLTVIQEHTANSMDKDLNAYGGLSISSLPLSDARGKQVVFAESDLNGSVGQECRDAYFNALIYAADDDDVEELLKGNASGTIVSYSVAPADPVNGSVCYKMLIDAQTYRLYMFKKHRINAKNGAGFMDYDIRFINLNLMKKK